MNFTLLRPEWLLLVIPCAIAFWIWRPRRPLSASLMAISMAATLLALAQPRIVWERPGGALVVVADLSKSMPPDSLDRHREIVSMLERRKGAEDLLGVVSFSDEICVEKMPDKGGFDGFKGWHSGMGSRLGDTLEAALAIMPSGRNGRILVLSDGRSTGPSPFEAGAAAASRSVPIDYRLLERPPWNDVAIESFDPPANAGPGEAFQFSANLSLPEDCEISYRLTREGVEVASGKSSMKAGRRKLVFQDRLASPGDVRYKLSLESSLGDQVKENNVAEAIVSVSGSKPLLIAGPAGSRLPKLAAEGGLQIAAAMPEEVDWTLDGLSKYKAVVLENVPAGKLGIRGQEALKHFVESTGGGLMLSGGRQSFGVGGYFASPLADVLPVSMELRREHRKLTTAVVVALDRSGSMAITVKGGKPKMDLANQGTVSVLELLSDGDTIGVVAVDSQAHVIVPPTKLKGDRGDMANRIRSIQSMGGGIFIFEALNHASNMLADVGAGTRHIILFADASDSEEPGNYKELLQKLKDNGITVSVIGLGTKADCDANLLIDIAARGEGNIYFTNAAEELPQLFSQEAIAVFRNAFVDEPTPLKKVEDLPLICRPPQEEPPPLGGFNLTYLKPGASVGLMTADSYKAPVLAFWSRGCGRALAFTGEIDGKFTGPFGSWSKAGELLLSCMRWVNQSASKEDDPDIFLRSFQSGGQAGAVIELDPERGRDPFLSLPQLLCLHESPAGIRKETVPFEWKDRNTLAADVRMPDSGSMRLYAIVEKPADKGGETVIPCSAFCLPYPQEFAPERDKARGRKTLMRLAELSGGVERLSVDDVFKDILPQKGGLPLWHLLALAAAATLVLEIAVRRLGLSAAGAADMLASSSKTASNRASSGLGKLFARQPGTTGRGTAPAPEAAPPPPSSPSGGGSLSGALSKAKDKSRKRMG